MKRKLRGADRLQDEEHQHAGRGDEEKRTPSDLVTEEASADRVNGGPDIQEGADEQLFGLVRD